MKIKFNDSETFINIDDHQTITLDRVLLTGTDIPENVSGFDVFDDNEMPLYLYPNHKIIYDIGDNFIEYTNDSNIYYVFYVYNQNKFITNQVITTDSILKNAILIKQGQGKEFTEAEPIEFIDKNGFFNYKVIENESGELVMIEVTDEEKSVMMDKKIIEQTLYSLENKLNEISATCQVGITNGINYKDKHYSYDITDQNNLKSAVELAKVTHLDVPYHADGESCDLYSLNDIMIIYVINETNLTHHTTYHNQLKLYIQSLTTKDEIENIQYGQSLTGEYLDKYNMIMKQSKKIISTYLGVEESIVDEILGSSTTISGVL